MTRNAAGEFIYTGDWFVYSGTVPRKRLICELWGLCGVAAVLLLVAGFLPAPGLIGCWYVQIPYVLSLGALLTVLWALGRLTLAGEPIRESVLYGAAQSLPRRLVLASVLSGLTAVCETLFLLSNREQNSLPLGIAFLALSAVGCVALVLARLRISRMSWEEKQK
ncbi:MAG: hypothetical protein IJ206_01505 [Oscillospiraceae bacterium]|nr:hypothetical protein [Oscillospiraceae bacterium]